jgi:hypothetical protein
MRKPVLSPLSQMTDVSHYSDADLYGVTFSETRNLALRGAASVELERRRRTYENARDAKQVEAALATAKATKLAAWAAGLSAFGALIQAVVAIAQLAK